MARQVQTFLDGLTQLLQLKGQEPLFFPQELRGVVEALPFAALANRQAITQSVVLTGSGTLNQLIVPADEVWLVESIGFLCTARQSGDELQLQLRYNPISGQSVLLAQSSVNRGTATLDADDQIAALWRPSSLFVLTAGDTLTGNAIKYSLGGALQPVSELQILYARFRK